MQFLIQIEVSYTSKARGSSQSARLQWHRNGREELPKSEVRGGGREELPHTPMHEAKGGSREEHPRHLLEWVLAAQAYLVSVVGSALQMETQLEVKGKNDKELYELQL